LFHSAISLLRLISIAPGAPIKNPGNLLILLKIIEIQLKYWDLLILIEILRGAPFFTTCYTQVELVVLETFLMFGFRELKTEAHPGRFGKIWLSANS
jgi:hypothetical protein